jgi:hypothetical protein
MRILVRDGGYIWIDSGRVDPSIELNNKIERRTTMINEKNIFEKGMLISIRAGAYTGRKKLSDEQLKGLPTEIVRGVHDLFDTDFKKLLVDIQTLDWEARHQIKKMSVPFPIDGVYFLVSSKINDAIGYLDDRKAERENLINGILEKYEDAVKAFAEKYPEYYKHAKDSYPTKSRLAEKFYFQYQFIKIAPPDENSLISSDQYKQEMKKFKESIQEMKDEVVGIIYQALFESVDRLKKQCTDGKPNQRTFDTLNKFLAQIDEVYADFVDRGDLKGMIKKIKAQVLGVTAEDLRNNEEMKKDFRDAISKVASEIKALPDIPLKRAIDF